MSAKTLRKFGRKARDRLHHQQPHDAHTAPALAADLPPEVTVPGAGRPSVIENVSVNAGKNKPVLPPKKPLVQTSAASREPEKMSLMSLNVEQLASAVSVFDLFLPKIAKSLQRDECDLLSALAKSGLGTNDRSFASVAGVFANRVSRCAGGSAGDLLTSNLDNTDSILSDSKVRGSMIVGGGGGMGSSSDQKGDSAEGSTSSVGGSLNSNTGGGSNGGNTANNNSNSVDNRSSLGARGSIIAGSAGGTGRGGGAAGTLWGDGTGDAMLDEKLANLGLLMTKVADCQREIAEARAECAALVASAASSMADAAKVGALPQAKTARGMWLRSKAAFEKTQQRLDSQRDKPGKGDSVAELEAACARARDDFATAEQFAAQAQRVAVERTEVSTLSSALIFLLAQQRLCQATLADIEPVLPALEERLELVAGGNIVAALRSQVPGADTSYRRFSAGEPAPAPSRPGSAVRARHSVQTRPLSDIPSRSLAEGGGGGGGGGGSTTESAGGSRDPLLLIDDINAADGSVLYRDQSTTLSPARAFRVDHDFSFASPTTLFPVSDGASILDTSLLVEEAVCSASHGEEVFTPKDNTTSIDDNSIGWRPAWEAAFGNGHSEELMRAVADRSSQVVTSPPRASATLSAAVQERQSVALDRSQRPPQVTPTTAPQIPVLAVVESDDPSDAYAGLGSASSVSSSWIAARLQTEIETEAEFLVRQKALPKPGIGRRRPPSVGSRTSTPTIGGSTSPVNNAPTSGMSAEDNSDAEVDSSQHHSDAFTPAYTQVDNPVDTVVSSEIIGTVDLRPRFESTADGNATADKSNATGCTNSTDEVAAVVQDEEEVFDWPDDDDDDALTASLVRFDDSATHVVGSSLLSPGQRVRALFSFDPRDDSELSIEENDIITIVESYDNSEWWLGELNGQVRLFPSNYTVPV